MKVADEQESLNNEVQQILDETLYYLWMRVGELPNTHQFIALSRVVNAIAVQHYEISTNLAKTAQQHVERAYKMHLERQ